MKTLLNKNFKQTKVTVLLLLLFVFGLSGWATTYSYAAVSGDLGTSSVVTNASVTLNSVAWSFSTTSATGVSYMGYDSSTGRGIQIGSSTNYCTSVILSTAAISGTINSVTVGAGSASSGNGTLTVSVGGVTYSPASVTLNTTTTPTTYTFTGTSSGTIVITYSQTAKKALYLKSIDVDYSTSSCTTPSAPVAGVNIAGEDTINWNWYSVAGATGYKYNTAADYASATDNGSDTTITQKGLVASTAYTMYVWAYNDCGVSDSTILSATTLKSTATAIPSVEADDDNISITTNNDNIEISSDNDMLKAVYVYNQAGILVNCSTDLHQSAVEVKEPSALGVYVVKVITEKKKVKTQKILIK